MNLPFIHIWSSYCWSKGLFGCHIFSRIRAQKAPRPSSIIDGMPTFPDGYDYVVDCQMGICMGMLYGQLRFWWYNEVNPMLWTIHNLVFCLATGNSWKWVAARARPRYPDNSHVNGHGPGSCIQQEVGSLRMLATQQQTCISFGKVGSILPFLKWWWLGDGSYGIGWQEAAS